MQKEKYCTPFNYSIVFHHYYVLAGGVANSVKEIVLYSNAHVYAQFNYLYSVSYTHLTLPTIYSV